MRCITALILAISLLTPFCAEADEIARATVYKDPDCGCCKAYVAYLQANGFVATPVDTSELPLIKKRHGIPEALEGCHTTIVGGYTVEGHVPVSAIRRLLAEKPAIRGISLPGMPEGSPGMSGDKREPFTIYTFTTNAEGRIFAVE